MLQKTLIRKSMVARQVMQKCRPLLLPLVVAFLPVIVVFFQEKPIPFLLMAAVVIWIAFESQKRRNLFRNQKLFLPFVVYLGVAIAYTILAKDWYLAIKQLEKQTAMLILPILIFGSTWNRKRIAFLLEVFLILLTISVFLGLGVLGWFYTMWSDWISVSGDHYYLFKFPHLLGVHPTYWSYLLVMGNGILLGNTYFKIIQSRNSIIFILLLFNLNLLLLSARTPMLVNGAIHFFAFIIFLRKQPLRLGLSIRIIAIVLGIFVILLLGIKHLPFLAMKITLIPEDERFFLWPKALAEIRNNYFFLGEGLGQGDVILQKYLNTIDDPRIYYRGFDLHNQYLKNFLDMGILGFLALLILICYPIYVTRHCWSTKAILGYCSSALLLLSMMTESVLSVLKGIVLFAVFIPIALVIHDDRRPKQEGS